MQELGWKRVAVLSEKGRKFEDYISALQAHAESNGITFLAVRKILSNTSFEVLTQITLEKKSDWVDPNLRRNMTHFLSLFE